MARRAFLRRVGALAPVALAASVPAGLLGAMARPGGTRQKPFTIVTLGDSIMWGQALHERDKIDSRVAYYLATRTGTPQQQPVRRAHSGASMLAGNEAPQSEAQADGRWDGEVPSRFPLIPAQVKSAVDELPGRGLTPEDVDLVILDGGINDTQILNAFMNPDPGIEGYFTNRVNEGAGVEMGRLLEGLLSTFPHCRIAVCGYYRVVSAQTPVEQLAALMAAVASSPLVFFPGELVAAAGIAAATATLYKNTIVGRMDRVVSLLNQRLGENVARLNASHGNGGRLVFVDPKFGPEHALGAPQTLLYSIPLPLVAPDPLWDHRSKVCADAELDPFNAGVCQIAAACHPTAEGARRYAEKIEEKLPLLFPCA